MNIKALVHGYPPIYNAGAEWMLHEMLRSLASKGHDVEVLLNKDFEPYTLDGVRVIRDRDLRKAVNECDIMISHLGQSGRALNACEFFHKPFVLIAHNCHDFDIIRIKHRADRNRWIYVIYNSNYVKKELKYPNPSIVVHPPVDPTRYKTKRGKKITLVNLYDLKGGSFFHTIAKLMPDYEFLGVEGGYGKQEKSDLPNVTYMPNTADAKKIYSQTRILLMPSQFESYGRTGIEAFCSGIPVIASPTPGLKESLGPAGIFCQLDSPLKWIEAIKSLDDEETYKKQSEKCKDRVSKIEQEINIELEKMEEFFNKIIEKRA